MAFNMLGMLIEPIRPLTSGRPCNPSFMLRQYTCMYLQNKTKKALLECRENCTVDFVVIGMHLNWPYACPNVNVCSPTPAL